MPIPILLRHNEFGYLWVKTEKVILEREKNGWFFAENKKQVKGCSISYSYRKRFKKNMPILISHPKHGRMHVYTKSELDCCLQGTLRVSPI